MGTSGVNPDAFPKKAINILLFMEINKIYNEDCVNLLKTFPDKCVDLVVTDPPYGMSYESNHYRGGNPFGKIAGDTFFDPSWITEFKRLAKKAVFVFCRWDNLKDLPQPKSFIVWVKNNWSAGDLNHEYGRMWEGILFYPMESHEFKKRMPDVIDVRRLPPTELLHPTQKPLPLIKLLIENNSVVGDIILDPFLGSGTTAVAAKELDRNYIGIELEKKYCDIAELRLLNVQERLF